MALKILVGLVGVPLLVLGLRSMFVPAGMAEAMSLSPRGAAGMNTMRSVVGGLFLACVAMLVLGLVTGVTTWFLAVTIVMAAVAVGRIVGIVADGFDKAVVPPLVVEIVIAAVLVAAHVSQNVS